jgi:hypothetical protein
MINNASAVPCVASARTDLLSLWLMTRIDARWNEKLSRNRKRILNDDAPNDAANIVKRFARRRLVPLAISLELGRVKNFASTFSTLSDDHPQKSTAPTVAEGVVVAPDRPAEFCRGRRRK